MNQTILQVQSNVEKDDTIDLRKYFDFLLDNRWLIAGVAVAVTLLSAAYAFLATPIYEANILIQVEDNAGNGGGPKNNILHDLSSTFDIKTGAASEMEILKSRLVVSQVVDNARLYINVQPKYFPGIGAWMARRSKTLSEPGLLGFGGYVWGAEKAEVALFNVPEALVGQEFVLTAEGDGKFRLTQDGEGIEIKGRVGETVGARTQKGDIELRVDHLAANPGAQFLLSRTARLDAIERLQNALTLSERGKQSGIIRATLNGPDPKSISAVLNEIGQQYIRQNVERRAAEADKSLAFLSKQLPELKRELERSESNYNQLRNKRGTLNLEEESKNILQQSVSSQTKLAELNQKKEELLIRYQDNHPAVEAINQQMRSLERELDRVNAKIKTLPAIEQDVLRLTRDVKVNTELYTALLSTSQQLRLVEASKVGNARLLDMAEPPLKPVKPKRMMVISLAVLFGLVLGAIAAFIRKTFYGRIDDPQEIRQMLGLNVSATIPHSASQKHLYAQMQSNSKAVSVLAQEEPSDSAIESLRNFRASLQFAMRESSNNIIVITSPTPGVGKSFVSANFAAVLGSVGKKVLLIDGDLRKGYLHRYFGLERRNGLSDAIAVEALLDRVIHRNVLENLDFISAGNFPPKPTELLAHENFGRLLQVLSKRYDFVLLDTAPVLAVSDALTVGPHAGAMFNIVRGGVSTMGEIEESVKRLNEAGATVTGTVFNDLKSRAGRYGYGYGSAYGRYGYEAGK